MASFLFTETAPSVCVSGNKGRGGLLVRGNGNGEVVEAVSQRRFSLDIMADRCRARATVQRFYEM
jgi:hypothetical protein